MWSKIECPKCHEYMNILEDYGQTEAMEYTAEKKSYICTDCWLTLDVTITLYSDAFIDAVNDTAIGSIYPEGEQ